MNNVDFDQMVEIHDEEKENVSLELFAEELADQADFVHPNFCTAATIGTAGSFSSASSCGSSFSSGSSISSAC
ncbi:MAG TPA: hypothetical protein VFA09_04135 [Ktedonobacteraceae bacterium]|jgi:hypothetical protein|nr:hypothetical protein [Ktedonobacteraceae bacterium]